MQNITLDKTAREYASNALSLVNTLLKTDFNISTIEPYGYTREWFSHNGRDFLNTYGVNPDSIDGIPEFIVIPQQTRDIFCVCLDDDRSREDCIYSCVSGFCSLICDKYSYDGDLMATFDDPPEVKKIIAEKHTELYGYAALVHKDVLYRRIGYCIWKEFFSHFIAHKLVNRLEKTVSDIKAFLPMLWKTGDATLPVIVGELMTLVFLCPQLWHGEVSVFSALDLSEYPGLPFQKVAEIISKHLGEKDFMKISMDFLSQIGQAFEAGVDAAGM